MLSWTDADPLMNDDTWDFPTYNTCKQDYTTDGTHTPLKTKAPHTPLRNYLYAIITASLHTQAANSTQSKPPYKHPDIIKS